MKIEQSETSGVVTISEGRFLPRFVRYFGVCSITGGATLLVCAVFVLFQQGGGFFQTTIAFALSGAAICYGIYLLFLFPDVRAELDRKNGKARISQQRLWDKKVRELELRRITALLVEKSEGSTGNEIFRIAFKTYKGEVIPLSGSWTENGRAIEADARTIHRSLDSGCSLDLPISLTMGQEKKGPEDVRPGVREERKISKTETSKPVRS